MIQKEIKDWTEVNQRFLMASVKLMQEQLQFYQSSLNKGKDDLSEVSTSIHAEADLKSPAGDLPFDSALDILVDTLGLSSFERSILLVCAGVELDSGLSRLMANLQGEPSSLLPTFSLALAALPDAHWSALSPGAPLRYWKLIELLNDRQFITKSPLKIDEHILHYITGVRHLNERLREVVEPVLADEPLMPSQQKLADSMKETCSLAFGNLTPVIQLAGDNNFDKAAICAVACSGLGKHLYTISTYSIPAASREMMDLALLWNREAALNALAILLDCTDFDTADKVRVQAVTNFIENVQGTLFINTDQWVPQVKRQKISFEVHKPTPEEQLKLWKVTLTGNADDQDLSLEGLVSQFNLSARGIKSVSLGVLRNPMIYRDDKNKPSGDLEKALWKACCVHTRPQVEHLAQRIEPVAKWDELILPEAQKEVLREIVAQVTQRSKVYNEWGFTDAGSRGLGISTLFSGESGTGKTMASEVLANELKLDLYRVDLSQVVNKYIGETEKNLKRIFDAAEEGGSILLFDEADALFGKRSDVKDSHDRYSNIEVSYLLQRMEAYRGLAILTTNMKNALDKAFMRRIRFVVQFPFPGAVQREEIWRRVFPRDTPTKDLDAGKLAQLNIPGGNIRNIALNAAFIAANASQPVSMLHVSKAARNEYNKLEKTLSSAEIGGWL